MSEEIFQRGCLCANAAAVAVEIIIVTIITHSTLHWRRLVSQNVKNNCVSRTNCPKLTTATKAIVSEFCDCGGGAENRNRENRHAIERVTEREERASSK